MRFVDLFAGLGGFHLAVSSLGGKCVFASEIEKDLRELYAKNFGVRPAGDIRDVDIKDIPDHELLCAGFPCQPFSKAGEQMGWKDKPRGTVFWKVIEILRIKKPKCVVLENVTHFVRHDEGNTYEKVRRAFEREGYQVEHRQYSPHQFGIPQIRERIYMVAYLGKRDSFPWPKQQTTSNELSIHSVLDKNPNNALKLSSRVIRCIDVWQEFLDILPSDAKLPSFPIWGMEFGATYPYDRGSLDRIPLADLQKKKGSFGQSLRGLPRKEILSRVPSHARGTSKVFPRWKQLFIQQNRDFFFEHQKLLEPWLPKLLHFPSSHQKLEWNCQGESRNLWQYVLQFRASGLRVKRDNTAPSLVAMTTTQIPIVGWDQRYMTARECARLQSMNKLKYLPKGIGAIQALGNAVNVTVVKKILAPWVPIMMAAECDARARAA
jgi:DNA (cytosine-5)-methyltransferase 1